MTTRVEIDSELVNAELEEYIQRRRQLQILELRGKIDYFS
jgi:hypothetical protein